MKIPAWVVGHSLGATSEVWIERQLVRFSNFHPTFLYWEKQNGWEFPDHVETVQLPYPSQPFEGPGRWWFRVRNMHHRNFFGSVGAERRFIQSLVATNCPRVILAHFGHCGLRMLPIARQFGIPTVVHFHGLDLSSALRNPWYQSSLKIGLPDFAACIVVGSMQKEILLNMGVPDSKVHVIPCGVPTDEFTPVQPIDDSSALRFLCVSRLVEFKGVRESILAFSRLLDFGVIAELTIIGDGEEREALEQLVRELNIEQYVTFLGSLASDKVKKWLQSSDIFLQHSLVGRNGSVEGFGVTVAEAAAVGIPVIATRCGGIIDQVVDGVTGVLVDERDVSGMATAMLELAHNPVLRKQLGQAGRERVVSLFDTTTQVKRLEAVLLEVAR